MLPRASGSITDSSLHVSFHLFASELHFMARAQTETQMENFIKEYVTLIWLLSTIFTVAV
jgi:hypothetical protein